MLKNVFFPSMKNNACTLSIKKMILGVPLFFFKNQGDGNTIKPKGFSQIVFNIASIIGRNVLRPVHEKRENRGLLFYLGYVFYG